MSRPPTIIIRIVFAFCRCRHFGIAERLLSLGNPASSKRNLCRQGHMARSAQLCSRCIWWLARGGKSRRHTGVSRIEAACFKRT
jgi:hypothetical protein